MTNTLDRTGATVDPARWPDIAIVPGGGLRARVARALFERMVRRLRIRVILPDGRLLGMGGPDAPAMYLHRPADFYRRAGAGGLIGFGESFMAGDWSADDVAELLTVFAGELATLVPPRLQRLRDLAVKKHPREDDGTLVGAQRNIARHYDLSNDLFALFLDETMTYSSALFPVDADGVPLAEQAGLADAQRRKINRLLDAAGVGAGSAVLEIGTGWGQLAILAAGRGATVRSITLSAEQKALAEARVAAAGLSDRVTIELCDYRAAAGQYDAVVSVEMIEAVGYAYLPEYFACLRRLLAPGGRIGLQSITMPHDRMLASRDTYTWIHKYIFPGGLIPSVPAIDAQAAAAGLHIEDRFAFGPHYAATLKLWSGRFAAATGPVQALGFDATFRRMWQLYLAYSEAGFSSGYLDVYQLVLAKEANA